MTATDLRKYVHKAGRWTAFAGLFVFIGGVYLSSPGVALFGGLLVFAGALAEIFGLVGSF